jgi:CRISPR/Cas system-associated exonuclease Cas4 (RecB family)
MKTTEQVKEEYIQSVYKFTEAQEEKSKTRSDGQLRDRAKDISVTDMCVWDTFCAKQVYYDKTARRQPTPQAQIRFTIGHVVHEIPMWKTDDEATNGHEIGFEWDGIRCRMDEFDIENGIIVDKKTVAALPRGPKDYVTKQLNIYRLIAEENEKRPIKVNQLMVLNLCVVNGEIQCLEVPMWTKDEAREFVRRVRDEIRYYVDNKIPPEIEYKSKGWICDNCQYADLCQKDQPGILFNKNEQQTLEKAASKTAASVRVNKKK